MNFTPRDHELMAHALRLAERGACTTRPNPMVGCVLVREEAIVGEGWHLRAGGPHAEAHALQAAGAAARGATAYVTLEPCAHHGRTPPCADALIEAGITRVVSACRDPFEQVDGAGVLRLRAAGVQVDTGLMEAQARALNRGFFSRIERGRPWLRIKLGMSLDGRTALADRQSKWITGEAARHDVARYRARSGALLTGIGTVLADDPRLTVRFDPDTADCAFEPPLRVVLDPSCRMPRAARLLREDEAPVLWLTSTEVPPPQDLPAHVEHAALPSSGEGGIALDAVLHLLAMRGINEAQVEAGAALCGALLRGGAVDELVLYVAPVLLGAAARPLFEGIDVESMDARFGMGLIEVRRIGDDLRLTLSPAG